LQAEHSGSLGRDLEGVGDTARDDGDSPSQDGSRLVAGDVQKDFAFQHVERLVGVGVPMEGCHLPGLEIIFEDQERPARFFCGGLPGVQTAPAEPAPFPVIARPNGDVFCGHVHSLSVYGT
jgi:hypothetical protein